MRPSKQRLTDQQAGSVPPFGVAFKIVGDADRVDLEVSAYGRWRVFRAVVNAFIVEGSYSFSTREFRGKFATPTIDRFSSELSLRKRSPSAPSESRVLQVPFRGPFERVPRATED